MALLSCLTDTPKPVEGPGRRRTYSGGDYENKTDIGIDHALRTFVPARHRGYPK